MSPARTAAALLLALVAAVRACTFGCTEGEVQTVLLTTDAVAHIDLFDMDSDRDLEVAVLFQQASGASWFTYNGAGWVEAGVVQSSTTDGDNTLVSLESFAIAHLNADNLPDFVFSYFFGQFVALDQGNGQTFDYVTIPSCVTQIYDMTLADFDVDGDVDVLLTRSTLMWFENADGTGSLWEPRLAWQDDPNLRITIAGDFNNDGLPDLVARIITSDDLHLRFNIDKAAAWSDAVVISEPGLGLDIVSLTAADFNGDGLLDVMYGFRAHPRIDVAFNRENGTVWETLQIETPSTGVEACDVADLDGDGDVDILFTTMQAVYWLENVDGSGQAWLQHAVYTFTGLREPEQVFARDVDGNGAVDVVVFEVPPMGSSIGHCVVTVFLSNVHATIEVRASAPPESCEFTATPPACPSLAEAVALAGRRPARIELVDATVVVEQPLVLSIPMLEIVGTAASGRSTIDCRVDGAGLACLTVDTGKSARFERVEFTGGTNSSLAVRDTFHMEIVDCVFNQNSGENGGALVIESSEVLITNTSFTSNTATAFGGAIYLASGDLSVYNSSFVDNHAGHAGGAIYHIQRQLPVVEEAYFEGNSAIYGNDLATPICTAGYVVPPSTEQSSGQPIRTDDNQFIQVQVLDCYSQRVLSAATVSIVFTFTNTTSGARQPSTGESYDSLAAGVVTASNLTVFGPAQQFNLIMTLDGKTVDTPFKFNVRQCEPGTYRDFTGTNICAVCPAGSYSSAAESKSCSACDAGFYCEASSTSATQHPCSAGRYGNVQGLTSPECSGVCRAGYYCPAGSTSDTAFPCGAGNYCPPGSGAPTPLPQGSCGIGHSPVTYSEFDWCLSISSVWPLSSPTTGGGILEIVGSQFFNVTVMLGEKVCPIAGSHNDTHLSCTIPAGVGFELDISITSLTNPGLASLAGVFSYEPPFVTAVTGCPGADGKSDCPTRGGTSITIEGGNFGTNDDEPVVLLGTSTFVCKDVDVLTTSTLTCTTPAGTGLDVPMTVVVGDQVSIPFTVSYARPEVYSVSGCQDVGEQGNTIPDGTVDCPRGGNSTVLTIVGQHFGPSGQLVLVGGRECPLALDQNTTDPDSELMCYLPKGSDETVAINVVQGNGVMSAGKPLVAYQPCPRGTRNLFDSAEGYYTCEPCALGTYSDQLQSYACKKCPNGQYVNPLSTGCLSCEEKTPGSVPSEGGTSCVCPPSFSLHNGACVCAPGLFYNPSGQFCDSCPIGKYQSSYSLAACTACPQGTTTDETGATNSTDCVCDHSKHFVMQLGSPELQCVCGPGTKYNPSDPDDVKCEPCAIGEYKSTYDLEQTCNLCSGVYLGTSTEGPGTSTDDGCVCNAGSYLALYSSPTTTGVVGQCNKCPSGTTCKTGTRVETIQVDAGYWRADPYSTEIWECQFADACPGGNATSMCAKGYEGPLCAVCEDGYASGVRQGQCVSCSSIPPEQIAVLCLLIILPLMLLMYCAYRKYQSLKNEGRVVRRSLLEWFKLRFRTASAGGGGAGGMVTRIKILFAYYQIVGGFSNFLGVNYPDLFEGFIGYLLILNLDFLDLLGLGCAFHTDFFDALLVMTLTPLCILVGLGIAYVLMQYQILIGGPTRVVFTSKLNQKATRELREEFAFLALILLYLVFPGVSAKLMATFACVELDDGGLYLQADYSISCTSTRYKAFLGYVALMIVLYPIGVTCLFATILYHFRTRINPPGVGMQEAIELRNKDAQVRLASFLFEAYQPRFWWFEVFECIRRLALTALPQLLISMENVQVVSVLLMCLVAVMVYTATKPYVYNLDNAIGSTTQAQLFLLVFIGLLLQFDANSENHDDDQRELGVFMIVMTNFVVISGLMMLTYLLAPSLWRGLQRCFSCLCCRRKEDGTWSLGIVDLLFPHVDPNGPNAKSEADPQDGGDDLKAAREPGDSFSKRSGAAVVIEQPASDAAKQDPPDADEDGDSFEEPNIRLTEWGEDFSPPSFDKVML